MNQNYTKHREPIYDAESDISHEVDEQNNETLNTRQLPDNNIRSYSTSITPEIWCTIFANGNLLNGYTSCLADHF